MKTAIHWFRRDLRLTDNPALLAAVRDAEQVIPVYVQSTWRGAHRWTGPHRQQFLCESLAALDADLRAIGSRLIVRRGDAVEQLAKLARETRSEAIFFNRSPAPRGRAVEDRLARGEMPTRAFAEVTLHEPHEALTKQGTPFRVFTPFANAWHRLEKPAPAGRLRRLVTPDTVSTEPLPRLADWDLSPAGSILPGGESAARARLKKFLNGSIARYAATRDLLAADGSSRLSQDLRHGLLSIREVYARTREKARELPAAERRGVESFINELAWREFSFSVLWHWPEVLEMDFHPKFRALRWTGRPENLARWANGETGFPIVDAAMRELRETGFMPNRARMIVAMFLTKDLQLNWRLGEAHFLRELTDGEIAINNAGWQWSAGTGADAAPYFRIQNPWTQSARYDPDGAYIRRWLPELRDVPSARLARPPRAGERLAKGYPAPMVDHAEARARTLAMFAAAR